MNTLSIPCTDGAVGNSNTANARYDALYTSVPSCAYLRPAYLSSRFDSHAPNGTGLFSGWTHVALAFRQDDVSFLESKRLASAILWVNILSATPSNHAVSAICPTGAAFAAGAAVGACAFTAAGGADVLPPVDATHLAGWKGFRIGSLAVLKNVLQRGVKLEDLGPGSNAVASFTAYPHLHATLAPYVEVQYEDEYTPPLCQALEPAATVVDSDLAVSFLWSYQQAVNAPQTHVSIRVRKTGGPWQDVVSKRPQTAQTYTAPGGIALRGECQWQVQVFCTAGAVASAWCDVKSFLSTGSPAAPAITGALGAPRCTLTWQQDAQTGFEIALLAADGGTSIYQSGQRLSAERAFTFPFLLADGSYTAQVRSLNAQGRWGPWASAQIRVENAPVGAITATATPGGGFPDSGGGFADGTIALCWQPSRDFDGYHILRDGTLIATLPAGQTGYTDRLALGLCRYVVRGLVGRHYTDSACCAATLAVPHALLGPVAAGPFIPLTLRRDAPPLHRQTRRANCRFVQYENGALPVAYTGCGQRRAHTLCFTLQSRAHYTALLALVGQPVIYKDREGDVFCGLLQGVCAQSGGGFDVEIGIVEVGGI